MNATEERLRDTLELAKVKLLEQDRMIKTFLTEPMSHAVVLSVGTKSVNSTHLPEDVDLKRGMRVKKKGRSARLGKIASREGNFSVVIKWDDGSTEPVSPLTLEPYVEPASIEIVTILYGAQLAEVAQPANLALSPGDLVRISMQTMAITGKVEASPVLGEVATVVANLHDKAEVEWGGSRRVVFCGRTSVEKGDRVLLDSTGVVIRKDLGRDDDRFAVKDSLRTITWDDIGGLSAAKSVMREAIELPYTHEPLFKFYGKKPIKGILLYGPPGCGKTLLGKAAATSMATLHGSAEAATGFLYVKGPEILDRWVGSSEATIRSIFDRARLHKETHGYPCVVFIDEADAILGKRGSARTSDMDKTIVPMFLTEMDGMEESGALVILATNRPDTLDPAVTRDGRIDRKVEIGRPTVETAPEYFRLHLQGKPTCKDTSLEDLIEHSVKDLFSESHILYAAQLKGGGVLNFTLGHVCNGGMIAGVVDHATSIALRRDLRDGTKHGLTRSDVNEAIREILAENRKLNHQDDFNATVADLKHNIVSVKALT